MKSYFLVIQNFIFTCTLIGSIANNFISTSKAISDVFEQLVQLNQPTVQKFFESTANPAQPPPPFYQPISGAPIGYTFIGAYVSTDGTGRYWVYKNEKDLLFFYDEPLKKIPHIITTTQQLSNKKYMGHYEKAGTTLYMYFKEEL